MEYDEYQAMIDLGTGGRPFFRTGSREICSPAPTDTDADFVVLDLNHNGNYEASGFTMTTGDIRDEYGETDFQTYRKGEINLIVLHDNTSFWKWRVATAAAKQMNLKDKYIRISLFQGVLYGNWS